MGAEFSLAASTKFDDDEEDPSQLSLRNLALNEQKKRELKDNIVMEQDLVYSKCSNGPYVVLSGTLDSIIDALFDPKFQDDSFTEDFVLGYRCLLEPDALIRILTQRYWNVEGMHAVDVIDVLSRLYEMDYDVRHNDRIRVELLQFLDAGLKAASGHEVERRMSMLARQVIMVDKQERHPQRDALITTPMTMAQGMIDMHIIAVAFAMVTIAVRRQAQAMEENLLLDVSPGELAREITLISHSLFVRIEPRECLHGIFNKEPEKAPNMTAWKDFSERMQAWVVTVLLKQKGLALRSRLYTKLVHTAEELLALNNFSDAMTLWMTLHSNPAINCLHRTIESAGHGCVTILDRLSSVLSPSARIEGRNDLSGPFIAYHYHLERAIPPCIPSQYVVALELFQTDFKRKDTMDNGHIDFVKLRSMASIIREVEKHQGQYYGYESNKVLCDYLLNCSVEMDQKKWRDAARQADQFDAHSH